jgi:methylated-DNA-[protein]-cysteine S-methyltransferase
MRCRSALTRIDALRTGELRPSEQGALKEHLRTCASCDDSFAHVDHLARAVRSLALTPPRSWRKAAGLADSFDRLGSGSSAIWVAHSERGIGMIFPGGSEDQFRERYARRHGRVLVKGKLPDSLRDQVAAALKGEKSGKPSLDLGKATELEREVLRMLTRIPRGEVRSYSWLARQVGRPRAVRAVANVVARNFVPFVVPCHRVVPEAGGIGQYAFGAATKRDLLRREGVEVEALEAFARQHVRFLGSRTTRIACTPTCRDARRIREENRVPLRGAQEAVEKGFRPCLRCRPFAA